MNESQSIPADISHAEDRKQSKYSDWNNFLELAAKKVQENAKNSHHSTVQFVTEDRDLFCGVPHGTVRGLGVFLNSKSNLPTSGYLPNSLAGANSGLERDRSKALSRVKPAVFNAMLLYQKNSKELKLIALQRNGIAFMNDFILKLKTALKHESEFSTAIGGISAKQNDTETASTSATDSDHPESSSAPKKLPKLGKVYAELRSCMKICEEMCQKRFSSIGQSCFELQGEMLLHVRWLVESRLRNIGRFVTAHFTDDTFDLDEVFCSNESKRFCKLFEVYNEYATWYNKNYGINEVELACRCGEQFTQSSISSPPGASNESYGKGMTELWNSPRPSVVYPILVRSILDILSESFMSAGGTRVSLILNSCQIPESPHNDIASSNSSQKTIASGLAWEDAAKIEIRPVRPQKSHNSSFFRVIKRVGGVNVPDIDTDIAEKQCAVLSEWFHKHEMVISSFISGLNGKTKILRRSHNFQDAYNSDDTMSVASSESKSMTSFGRHSETKTVVWRDSWSNDTMKSISAHYMDFLTKSLPVLFNISLSNDNKISNGPEKEMRLEKYRFSSMKDMNIILLQAVVSNLGHLNVMSHDLHASLLSISTEIVVHSAVSRSDIVFCEMLGKCSPSFDKSNIQKMQGTNISLASQLCLSSLQPLLHVLELYSHNDIVAKSVLPRVEAILNAGFWWIRRKIQNFFSTWDLGSLLQMCLCDLREITNISLDCLRLVESCHNHIETKRNQNAATLLIATKHLQNIDTIITNMQVASGSCMLQLGKETRKAASRILVNHFPSQKFWLQKNLIDNEAENRYIKEFIKSLLQNACAVVSDMDAQLQLAAMTPIINSIYDVCLEHIAKLKIKFTMQGASQLSYDFSTVINFVKSDNSGLSYEAQSALSSLHSVSRALHVAGLLQNTSYVNEGFIDDRFRPQSKIRSSTASLQDDDDQEERGAGGLNDQFWLSLRKHNIGRSKTWTSFLPCVDNK